ncbi:hypothetical protein CDIK_1732 [Cucumispora dikerogammari]|nr:hypothetical protein CDIK_1732 [Cucumispora dikerogammari]
MMIIYEWCQQAIIKQIKHEYGVNYSSINAIFTIIRTIITEKKDRKVEGICEIVEVDETCLSSRKNNKGIVRKISCVGSILRENKKMFLELLISRNMINLNTIISKHVNVNTLIMTDRWRGYLDVENIKFLHESISHFKNFVGSLEKSIHTQNIECL